MSEMIGSDTTPECDFTELGKEFGLLLNEDREVRLEQLTRFFDGVAIHDDALMVVRAVQQAKADAASEASSERNQRIRDERLADRSARAQGRRSKKDMHQEPYPRFVKIIERKELNRLQLLAAKARNRIDGNQQLVGDELDEKGQAAWDEYFASQSVEQQ